MIWHMQGKLSTPIQTHIPRWQSNCIEVSTHCPSCRILLVATQPKTRTYSRRKGDCWNLVRYGGTEYVPLEAFREYLLALLRSGLFDDAEWLRDILALWEEHDDLRPEEVFRW